jgi:hypothetical protein
LLSKAQYIEDEATILKAEMDELSEEELGQFSALLVEAMTLPPLPIAFVQE